MQCEEGTDWLLELLLEVQLQQYFLRLRDELNVTRLSHFDYVKNEDLEKIGMGRPGEFPPRDGPVFWVHSGSAQERGRGQPLVETLLLRPSGPQMKTPPH